ncbi:MAG: hypothetical protein EOP19_07530 [Hyphomicrobiales bacterium]|nr:MAG: hypothetical protein EOP19_07530 [Hyphomicrobiales bacterium]
MAIEKTTIDGIDYDMWSVVGTVTGVLMKSTTDVWTSGGGGYFDPRGGGYIQPVQVQSSTRNFKEVRIDGDDGDARTVTLADHIKVFAGDRVTLSYIGTAKGQRGWVHGITNHREKHWWTFNTNSIAKPHFGKSLYRAVARFIGDHRFISYAVGLLAVTTIASTNYRPMYRMSQMPRDPVNPWLGQLVDGFWPTTILLVAVITVCWATTTALRKKVNKAALTTINAFTAKQTDTNQAASEAEAA